jgi:hypothetical protein
MPYKYSKEVSSILFDNKEKIEWEWDNLIKRKVNKIWSSFTNKSNIAGQTGKKCKNDKKKCKNSSQYAILVALS